MELMLLSNTKGRENFRHRQLILVKIIKTNHYIYIYMFYILQCMLRWNLQGTS